ncbi:hypothetical protein ACN28S_58265 [Cystobacter fuscus]
MSSYHHDNELKSFTLGKFAGHGSSGKCIVYPVGIEVQLIRWMVSEYQDVLSRYSSLSQDIIGEGDVMEVASLG